MNLQAFMDLSVFYEVIVPLLEMDSTALICISTPQDSLNFYSEMFDMKGPDDMPLFRTIQVGLSCEACLKAGKGGECPHNTDEIPPWKSKEKFDFVKTLYGDKKELLLRESVGSITEDQSSLFPTHWVDRFMDSETTLDPALVRYVIVACDPNGGGDSQMAIVSSVFHRGSLVIVGVDSHAVRGHDQIEILLLAHVKALRLIWKAAWFIFVAESNLGQEADHMRHMLKDHGYVYTVCEEGVSGVRTTNKRKELYSMELCKFLSQDAASIDTKCVSVNPMSGATCKADTMALMRKQLIGFRKIILKSTTGRSEARVCYTGKSQGAMDDIVVTLTIAAYWGVQFLTKRIPGVPYDQLTAT